jgi:small subunit ribosomal protein S20
MTRQIHDAIAAGDKKTAEERLRELSKALAKAASKGLLHPSNASRRTSRLSRRVAAINR